jgi:2,4-diaminopentanoate dehydrogenase
MELEIFLPNGRGLLFLAFVTRASPARGTRPWRRAPQWREQLAAAAQSGRSSLYASGIFPEFGSDQLALVLATQSKTIRTVRVTEVSLNDHYPVASVMMDGMGFGRPLDFTPLLSQPGVIEGSWSGPIHLIAEGLGARVEEVRQPLACGVVEHR